MKRALGLHACAASAAATSRAPTASSPASAAAESPARAISGRLSTMPMVAVATAMNRATGTKRRTGDGTTERGDDPRGRPRSWPLTRDRQHRLQPRAGTRVAVHAQCAAERLDPVGEPAQPRAARRVGAAHAVVGHAHHEPDGVARTTMSALAPPAYLATFARPSSRGRTPPPLRRRKAAGGHLEADRNGGLRDQLVEGLAEAAFGERARVNTPREPSSSARRRRGLPKPAQRLSGLPSRSPASRDMRSRRPASRCSAPACNLSTKRRLRRHAPRPAAREAATSPMRAAISA